MSIGGGVVELCQDHFLPSTTKGDCVKSNRQDLFSFVFYFFLSILSTFHSLTKANLKEK